MGDRYKSFTKEECLIWIKNNNINPRTGRELKKNSIIIKELKKQCKLYNDGDDKEEKDIEKVQVNQKKEKNTEKKKELTKSILEIPLNKDECLKWYSNQDKNPRTNYTLIKNGKLYNLIKEQCKLYDVKFLIII